MGKKIKLSDRTVKIDIEKKEWCGYGQRDCELNVDDGCPHFDGDDCKHPDKFSE